MSRPYLAILALYLTTGCQLFGGPDQSPEDFATSAVRAVAMNDFGAYLPLCAKGSDAIAAQGAKSLAATLDPVETRQIRDRFDRVVRSNRLRAFSVDKYRTKLRAKEHERWVYDVHDGDGKAVGVQLSVQRVGSSYRLVGLNLL